jgi:hypothetical protein
MLHITKLAVGVRDLDHLRMLQRARAAADPPLRHLTRSFPQRAAELLQGGSIYWVVGGATCARQRLVDIVHARRADGSACTGLVLDPELVPVAGRAVRPFQGWRYLAAESAPPDLTAPDTDSGLQGLPPRLLQDLRALCLL